MARFGWAALCVALYSCVLIFPVAASGSYRIIWTVGFMSPQGATYRDVKEKEVFASKKDCDKFGDKMVLRMEDWVRGALVQDWDFPVMAVWRCEAEGDPA